MEALHLIHHHLFLPLPVNVPSSFDMTIVIDSYSDLGIDLGTVGFFAFFEGTEVGRE